jgi:hypothetical protein
MIPSLVEEFRMFVQQLAECLHVAPDRDIQILRGQLLLPIAGGDVQGTLPALGDGNRVMLLSVHDDHLSDIV